MKIKHLFLSGLMCCTFAACSNSDEPTVENELQGNEEMYVAIQIQNPDQTKARGLSRAETYTNGTAEEYAVKSIYCLFYGSDKNYLTSSYITGLTDQSQTGNLDNKTTAVLVLENITTKPVYVVTFVNTEKITELEGLSMENTALTQYIWNATSPFTDTTNGFVMSTSTYEDNSNNVIYWTPILNTKVLTTKPTDLTSLTDEQVVDIYVERIAAKVTVKQGETYSATITADGEDAPTLNYLNDGTPTAVTNATWTFTGTWGLNATNKTTYLLKNLDSNWTETEWTGTYNNATNFRSYWSKDPNYTDGTYFKDYYTYNTSGNQSNASLDYKAVSELNNDFSATGSTQYCLENTMKSPALTGAESPNTTQLLIVGNWSVKIGENQLFDAETDPADLVYVAGAYYTVDAYKAYMLNVITQGATDLYTHDSSTSIATTDLQVKHIKGESGADKVCLELTDAAKTNTWSKKGGTATDENIEEEINSALANANYVAEGFKDGACYYAVNIKHDLADEGEGSIGIVRNHWYELTIDGIKKMGTGIWDPTLDIIPETNERYQVAARLNVLSWRKVTQDNIVIE